MPAWSHTPPPDVLAPPLDVLLVRLVRLAPPPVSLVPAYGHKCDLIGSHERAGCQLDCLDQSDLNPIILLVAPYMLAWASACMEQYASCTHAWLVVFTCSLRMCTQGSMCSHAPCSCTRRARCVHSPLAHLSALSLCLC